MSLFQGRGHFDGSFTRPKPDREEPPRDETPLRPELVVRKGSGLDLAAIASDLHRDLVEGLDHQQLDNASDDEARALIEEATAALIVSKGVAVHGEQRRALIKIVIDDVLGHGPIQPLLDDPSVSEIMVNGYNVIYFERKGTITRSDIHFRDEEHLRRVADRILSAIGRRVDESAPLVDARLADGSRVNITIPPATPRYTTMTIRKFKQDRFNMADIVRVGSMSEPMHQFLAACVEFKRNILVSGGTGSGKTTFLNALSAFIPEGERVVTIEDPIELNLQQQHVVCMEARPPDIQGLHAITQGDLLRNALRMRPDRIVVGEIRGAEAFEMLQAMNTGHEGSLSTVHANTPRDALSRVENMVLQTGIELPMSAIREQVASAIHLVVQLSRFRDGVRRVTKITEIVGMESGRVTVQDLFSFEVSGRGPNGEVLGSYKPSGLRPTFTEELEAYGCHLPASMFLEDMA